MTKQYNLKNIRALLTEGFDAEELRRLCHEESDFRPVYNKLAQDTGKATIVDWLLEYANAKLQIETLLTWAKENNPARYEKYQPYYDPYHDYLQQLYDRISKFLSVKLIKSLDDDENRPEPIHLSIERTQGAVDVLFEKHEEIDPLFVIGGIAGEPLQEFDDFAKAFDYYDGRVLLLGAPGAGKTITLLHYARDTVVKRLQDMSAPLPILGIVPTWNADEQHEIADWLDKSYGAPMNAAAIIRNGQALLLLDGLDELGTERKDLRTEEKYDPRLRFIEKIPDNNRILITCRAQDYRDIGKKLRVRGAATLKPLTDLQIQFYLRTQIELLEVIESDVRLKEWLNTPLLLSFFAFTYMGLSASERNDLLKIKNAGDLRDKIYARYVEQRYEHERHKLHSQLTFTLDDIYEFLGICAVYSGIVIYVDSQPPGHAWGAEWRLVAHFANFRDRLGLNTQDYLYQLAKLNLLISDGAMYRFIHPTMRDYFAYTYATNSIEAYNQGVSDADWAFRLYSCIEAMEELKDIRSLTHIVTQFNTDLETRRDFYIYELAYAAFETLLKDAAQSHSTEAIDIIVKYLDFNTNPASSLFPPICAQIAAALELIGSSEALEPVHTWRKTASLAFQADADKIKQEWATPKTD